LWSSWARSSTTVKAPITMSSNWSSNVVGGLVPHQFLWVRPQPSRAYQALRQCVRNVPPGSPKLLFPLLIGAVPLSRSLEWPTSPNPHPLTLIPPNTPRFRHQPSQHTS
jgi:hypothetical protein